ncbi:MAG: HEAT repeat domain-containing protein [Deltaproteobacteria bacterium]|jgi:cyclophilin family peptidyl-prolyl cis-trans isomerase/HEAT repeat protein
MRRWLVALFTLTACAGPLKSSISPADLLRRVEDAEARRDAASPAVARALGRQEERLRIAGLMTLARTEAVGTSSLARVLVGDRDPKVATWAAFSLGQIGDAAVTATLLTAADSKASVVPDQILLALGRAGTATTARLLIPHLSDDSAPVRGAAALAIGLIAKRDLEPLAPDRFEAALAPLLSDADRDVRFGATYALMRLESPGAAVMLIRLLADADPEIRANAVYGLGRAHSAPQVLDAVMADPDWRVRVQLARALGEIAKHDESDAPAASIRLGALGTKSFARFRKGDPLASGRATHVLLAVADAAAQSPKFGRKVLEGLESAPWSMDGLAEASIPDVARVQCRVAYHLDRIDEEIKRVRTCGKPSYPEWARQVMVTRLLAARGGARSIQSLVNLASGQDPKVRVAAILALGTIETREATEALRPFVRSNDAYVATATAEILARPARAGLRYDGLVSDLGATLVSTIEDPDSSRVALVLDAIKNLGSAAAPLLGTLEKLDTDPRIAIRRRAAQARAAITNTPVAFSPLKTAPAAAGPTPTRRVRLAFDTVRGTAVIELFGDVAPNTTANLVALAAQGFYTDLTFHRVVADFVVQSGCPRGDGWGIGGSVIRDETSPLPFVRGAVGIATNGRDTGGSQIFVMHAHHPHLEGGYTLVGQVLEGIEVIDALQEDDRILGVRLLASKP